MHLAYLRTQPDITGNSHYWWAYASDVSILYPGLGLACWGYPVRIRYVSSTYPEHIRTIRPTYHYSVRCQKDKFNKQHTIAWDIIKVSNVTLGQVEPVATACSWWNALEKQGRLSCFETTHIITQWRSSPRNSGSSSIKKRNSTIATVWNPKAIMSWSSLAPVRQPVNSPTSFLDLKEC
jgi:hypothetical protein